MEKESIAEPGVHYYERSGGFDRRSVEAIHDWTIANGLESELEYVPQAGGWCQRVRHPGDTEPEFLEETAARKLAARD